MQNFSKAAELKAKAEQLRAKVGISSEDGEEIKITNTSNVDDGIDKDLMELERLDQFEELLDMAFADGVLTDQEKEVIMKKSRGLGIDADETEMILEAKTYELGATRNKNSNESCDSEISAPNYQKEFDKIKNQGFRPISQVVFLSGRRKVYDNDDREEHSRIETKRIKNECCAFIDSIYPTNQVETIDAFNFLSRFLPSPSIDVLIPKMSYFGNCGNFDYDRDFATRAVSKIKTLIKESEDSYSDNVDVMNNVKVVRERLASLVNTLKMELERSEDYIANFDKYFEEEVLAFNESFKPYRTKRYRRWGIFGITLAAAWLLAGYGWGWSVVINVLTI